MYTHGFLCLSVCHLVSLNESVLSLEWGRVPGHFQGGGRHGGHCDGLRGHRWSCSRWEFSLDSYYVSRQLCVRVGSREDLFHSSNENEPKAVPCYSTVPHICMNTTRQCAPEAREKAISPHFIIPLQPFLPPPPAPLAYPHLSLPCLWYVWPTKL